MKNTSLLSVLATAAFTMFALSAAAQVIVSEDFENYADQAALNVNWANPALTPDLAVLADDTFTEFITLDDLVPQDIGARAFPSGGQGVHHIGGQVYEYLPLLNSGSPLFPTTEKSIVVQGDIFDAGATGNKRLSIGLRASGGQNIVELGFWNTEDINYAYRAILFPSTPEEPNPNWQFFDGLPAVLDRPDDDDDFVNPADIGEAWHTYKATITPDTITYQIDLFRDGLDAATGTTGWDQTVTVNVTTGGLGYDSLRIGGPSNVSSPGNNTYGGAFFDNISVELVDAVVMMIPGDANGDGNVDLLDLDILGMNFGSMTGNGASDGDFNGDGEVDLLDLDILGMNFGFMSPATAVPEPAGLALLAASLSMIVFKRR